MKNHYRHHYNSKFTEDMACLLGAIVLVGIGCGIVALLLRAESLGMIWQ